MKRISFVGVGNMGAPMAANLVKAGMHVKLYDGNPDRAVEVATMIDATPADSLSDVADCDVCFLMLPTSAVVREVLVTAEDGAFLKAAKAGTIVIDMSSSEPQETQETGRILASKDVVFIDAPVSGGVPRAMDGSLTIMIGTNDAKALGEVTPLLQQLGSRLFHVGPLGAGDAMKAANNFAAAAAFAATAEALQMGIAFGLDPSLMVDIIATSTGRSFASEVLMKDQVLNRKYASGFGLDLLAKDVGIANRLAEHLGVQAPVARLVAQRYRDAVEALGSGRDNTEAMRAWYKDF